MSPRLDLEVERTTCRPGGRIGGRVVVLEGGSSRSLDVRLEYIEETSDYLEVATSVSSGRLHEGDLEPGMSFAFEIALAPHALPCVRSRHGELYWRLDAKSDERGRDTHAYRRIDVTL